MERKEIMKDSKTLESWVGSFGSLTAHTVPELGHSTPGPG